jgi:uncharacterized protein
MQYIYLHGFASGPQSRKAQDLGDRFHHLALPLHIPDLNQGDFTHLTLTRQIHQVESFLAPDAVTLIGSSLGGLTAAWVAQRSPQVQRLVLLAPAFHFLDHWLPKLGPAQHQQWQHTGTLAVFHHGLNRQMPLDYGFLTDCAQYAEADLQRPLPTLILHGTQDHVIPYTASVDFAQTRPWVTLLPLESDHGLLDVGDRIWAAIAQFCQLPPEHPPEHPPAAPLPTPETPEA